MPPRKRPLVVPPPPETLPTPDPEEKVAAPPPQRRERAKRMPSAAATMAALNKRATRTANLPCRLDFYVALEDYTAAVELAEEYGEELSVVLRTIFRRGLRATQFTPAPQAGQRPFYDGLPPSRQVPLGTEWPPVPPRADAFQRPQQQTPWQPPPARVVITDDVEAVYANAQVNPAMLPQGYTAPIDRPAPPPPPEPAPPGTVDAPSDEPRLFVD